MRNSFNKHYINNKIYNSDFKKRKENGVVYTPRKLGNYVANKLIKSFLNDFKNKKIRDKYISNLKLIDPACGEGDLLVASWDALSSNLDMHDANPISIMCGIDLDSNSIRRTKENINNLSKFAKQDNLNLLVTNALLPRNKKMKVDNWDSLKLAFGAKSGFDLLIANPPWGANTSSYERKLGKEFSLNKGQYDSADLFVELAINIVKKGGYFAFILPDSLFGFEHMQLRKMLLEKTEIKFIGRLGEKIFGGVNRACVVIICKNITPSKTNKIKCMRLSPKLRSSILHGKTTFLKVEESISHYISQSRFSNNIEYIFDIDNKAKDAKLMKLISASNNTVGGYVDSSRGVELSKVGLVYECNNCKYWSPLSKKSTFICKFCGSFSNAKKTKNTKIINKIKLKSSSPILVGESVRRYSIVSRFWIDLSKKGINYKNKALYLDPKILVRKTGVGITATIDYSNSLTNQVVYILKPKNDSKNTIPIEFILAVMNSRVVYYFLLKKYGESEWRSHPYLTQSQVLRLPLPNLSTSLAKNNIKEIARILKPYLKKKLKLPKSIDANIEFLIAKMFNMDIEDYGVIYNTLNNTQGLIPVKELMAVGITDIFKK